MVESLVDKKTIGLAWALVNVTNLNLSKAEGPLIDLIYNIF